MGLRSTGRNEPQLSDFQGIPAQALQQPAVPSSIQDMLLKGEQFVQQASESGMLCDPTELTKRFMLARPDPPEAERIRIFQSQRHSTQQDAASESAGVQGAALLEVLRSLLQKPSYTDDDIALIQRVNSLSQQLMSRLQQIQGHQLPVSAPTQTPPSLTPVLTSQPLHSNRQEEAPGWQKGHATSVLATQSQPPQAMATPPCASHPQQHVATTSRLMVCSQCIMH